MKLHADDTFGQKYKIKKKIGAGSFGEIYLAVDMKSNEEVAIKTESKHCKYPQVIYEAKVLKLLQKADGIPQVHHFASEGEFNYMVIDILGPSLEDLFNYCGREFTLKTTLMLIIQLVERFRYIHKRTFVHRDIKPDNFLMGIKDKSHVAYIVDYGLAKRFYDPKTQTHIPYRNDKSLTGTARYASIHAHLGEELSRRDDLEALGFVMLYFYKGQLPWQNLPAFSKSEKYRRIKETKVSTTLEDLCQNCPSEFLTYMKHCRNLTFEEKPDYDMLLSILKKISEREGINLEDREYDWVNKKENIVRNLKERSNLHNQINQINNNKEESKHENKLLVSKKKESSNNNVQIQSQQQQNNQQVSGTNLEQQQLQQQNPEQQKKGFQFQFASFLDAQRMIRGDQYRFMDLDGENNNILQYEAQYYQAYNQDMRKREILQLKQDFQELKARGFKRKNNPQPETVKKEPLHQGPSFNQGKRQKFNEFKNEIYNDQQAKPNENGLLNAKLNNQMENKSSEVQTERSCEEGVGNIDSKSFGAKASKFQTQPNKRKGKVIIVDDEEEKEFGINTSINNHISNGTLNGIGVGGNHITVQNILGTNGALYLNKNGFESSPLHGKLSPCMRSGDVNQSYLLDRVKSQNWPQNPIQEESEDDLGGDASFKINRKTQNKQYQSQLEYRQRKKSAGGEKIKEGIVEKSDETSKHCIIM